MQAQTPLGYSPYDSERMWALWHGLREGRYEDDGSLGQILGECHLDLLMETELAYRVVERDVSESNHTVVPAPIRDLMKPEPKFRLAGDTSPALERLSQQAVHKLKAIRHKAKLPLVSETRYDKGIPQLHNDQLVFLFTPVDLLSFSSLCECFVPPTPARVRAHLGALDPSNPQAGVEDEVYADWAERLHDLQASQGEPSPLPSVEVDEALSMARCGCHPGARRRLWDSIIPTNPESPRPQTNTAATQDPPDKQSAVSEGGVGSVLDLLILSDIASSATGYDHFVFIHEAFALERLVVLDASFRAALWGEQGRAVFPSGIMPFKGMVVPFLNLFYLYDADDILPIARSMYLLFFHHLHSLAHHPCAFPSLMHAYKVHMERAAPGLRALMVQRGFEVDATVAEWIITAFGGVVTPGEWLKLWDRIITLGGYWGLQLLPLLASAILTFRAPILVTLRDPRDIADSLKVLTGISVIPLIQLFVFR